MQRLEKCATPCAIRTKKENPRKRSVYGGFLACLTRFERAAFRVGVDKTDVPENLDGVWKIPKNPVI